MIDTEYTFDADRLETIAGLLDKRAKMPDTPLAIYERREIKQVMPYTMECRAVLDKYLHIPPNMDYILLDFAEHLLSGKEYKNTDLTKITKPQYLYMFELYIKKIDKTKA